MKGIAEHELEKYSNALITLNSIKDIEQINPESFFTYRGLTNMELENFEDAKKDFKTGIELGNENLKDLLDSLN